MIVVADTSPLNYLVLIEQVAILPGLYDSVYLTPVCLDELRAARTPPIVREWAEAPPDWLTVRAPRATPNPNLADLDPGEREAIALALELPGAFVLIDDRMGRASAQECGLVVAGTLRVLAEADAAGMLSLEEAFLRLRQTTFRADEGLFQALLRERRER